jgi:hypothetical protein
MIIKRIPRDKPQGEIIDTSHDIALEIAWHGQVIKITESPEGALSVSAKEGILVVMPRTANTISIEVTQP